MTTATIETPKATVAAPARKQRLVSYEPSNSWIKRVDSEGEMVIQSAWCDLGRTKMGYETPKGRNRSPIVVRGDSRRIYGSRACLERGHITPDKAAKDQHARDWFYATLRPSDSFCDITIVVSHWDQEVGREMAKSLMGEYNAIVNGHEVQGARVVNVIPILEGFGTWHLMNASGQLQPGSTLLIELGQGTSENFMFSADGDVTGEVTEDLCVRNLVQRLADHPTMLALSGSASQGFNPALITSALATGQSPSQKLTLERWEAIRESVVDEWASEVFHYICNTHSDRLQHVANVVICGGGAALLGDRIQPPFSVPSCPELASVSGAYQWGLSRIAAAQSRGK